jgi:hypothetical protein
LNRHFLCFERSIKSWPVNSQLVSSSQYKAQSQKTFGLSTNFSF